ncbi:MAG: energy transducer TonB [Desulfobulbus sp.]|nr:MAG: energy transducer TonB [Desulfobulbus sp.]
MPTSSDFRIIVALAASLAVHAALLGMSHKSTQPRLSRLPARQITFRLVPRPAEAPKEQAPVVQPAEVPKAEPVKTPPPKPAPAPRKASAPAPAKPAPKPAEVAPLAAAPVERQVREERAVGNDPSTAVPPTASPPEPAEAIRLARPLYRSNPPPPYPEKARRRNLQGTVLLEVTVSAAGRVEGLRIKESCGHRILDQAAEAAVSRWQFEPGRKNGVPVAMTVLVPVRFNLR